MPPTRLSVVLGSIVGAYDILDNVALSSLLDVGIRSDAANESDARKLRGAGGGESAGEGGRGEWGAAEGGCEERHGGWEGVDGLGERDSWGAAVKR
jgi:hypothetical protein